MPCHAVLIRLIDSTGALTAALFKTCSPAGAEAIYLSKNHPLPITAKSTIDIQVVLALLTSIFILVPLCYIPASFVSFLVKERVSKSKHLQIVSSVSPYLYWVATFAWDMLLFFVLIAFLFLILVLFNTQKPVLFISSAEAALALFLLLVTYGASAIALNYVYSLAFENFSTAQISIMAINFFSGFVFVLAYYVMISVPETKDAGTKIVHFFRFFPPYNIGNSSLSFTPSLLLLLYTSSTLSRRRGTDQSQHELLLQLDIEAEHELLGVGGDGQEHRLHDHRVYRLLLGAAVDRVHAAAQCPRPPRALAGAEVPPVARSGQRRGERHFG